MANIKVLVIAMGVNKVFTSLIESSIHIVGVIESKPRDSNKQARKLEHFCLEQGLPYFFMSEGCNDKLENWVQLHGPDLIVVLGMSELLKKNILTIPKKGCINLHPTLLPKYRGSHPFFWLYYDMDLNPGVTIHYINEGEDTGNIIYQESFHMPLGFTEEELIEYLELKIGAKLLVKAIRDIGNNCAPSIQQPSKSPTVRARRIHPNEYKELIDWENWGIERIWHLLRGTQNWLNVFDFSEVQGKVSKWRILHYVKEDIIALFEQGKVYKGANLYYVLCGQGKIYMDLLVET